MNFFPPCEPPEKGNLFRKKWLKIASSTT